MIKSAPSDTLSMKVILDDCEHRDVEVPALVLKETKAPKDFTAIERVSSGTRFVAEEERECQSDSGR